MRGRGHGDPAARPRTSSVSLALRVPGTPCPWHSVSWEGTAHSYLRSVPLTHSLPRQQPRTPRARAGRAHLPPGGRPASPRAAGEGALLALLSGEEAARGGLFPCLSPTAAWRGTVVARSASVRDPGDNASGASSARASQRHEPPLLVITHSHAPSHRAGQAMRSRPGVRWRGRPLGGRRRTTLRERWPTQVRGGVIVAGMGAGCAGDGAHPAQKTTRMSHVAGTATRGDAARARRVPHGGRGPGSGRRPSP